LLPVDCCLFNNKILIVLTIAVGITTHCAIATAISKKMSQVVASVASPTTDDFLSHLPSLLAVLAQSSCLYICNFHWFIASVV